MKRLWMLVGGNGAGKSTFFHQALEPLGLPFVNADLIARETFPDDPEGNSYKAAKLAETLREDLIRQGRSFCFETVFSHPSKIDFLARAKAAGYTIVLVLIHLATRDLNKARIAGRVSEGGHHVPDEKVDSRIPRTLANVKAAIPLCDEVRVLDNSRLDKAFEPVITLKKGRVFFQASPLPDWASSLLEHGN